MIRSIGISEFLLLPVILVLAVLPIITAVWVYRDATSRNNKDAAIWAVGSALAWPLVVIIYLIIRPGAQQNTP